MPIRFCVLIAAMLVLAACGNPAQVLESPGSGEPSGDAVATPSGEAGGFPAGPPPDGCVRPPPDISTLIEQPNPVPCYGNASLHVDALLQTNFGVMDCPGELQPDWFGCANQVALFPLPPTAQVLDAILIARSPPNGSLYAVVHPEADLRDGPIDALVRVTGHYDDPQAMECAYLSWPDADPPSAESVIDGCRSMFVITGIEAYVPPDASPEPSEPSEPSANGLQPHNIAQVVTDDLVVRSAPGVGTDSEIHLITLDAPTLLYILEGPVAAGGYEWFHVVPADMSYLPTGYEIGWVAAGRGGEAWIGPAEPACPSPVMEEIVQLSDLARLACFGGQPLTLDGTFSGCAEGGGAANSPTWLWSSTCQLLPFNHRTDVIPSPGGIAARVTGNIGLTDGDRGTAVRMEGHYDDPAARTCTSSSSDEISSLAAWPIFVCRTQFVVDDAYRLAAP